MAYIPRSGSDIAKIYECIKTQQHDKTTLADALLNNDKKFPIRTISVHLRYLIKKKLVMRVGDTYLRNDGNKQSVSLCVLHYCQDRIGKKVTSVILIDQCCGDNKKNTAPATELKKLVLLGAITRLDGPKPYEYLVLPEIKTLDKIPASLPATPTTIARVETVESNDAIADLSIGQILTEYVRLKDENRRLKDALQRIANELHHIGEMEQ